MIEICSFKKEFLNDIEAIEKDSFANAWSKDMFLSSFADKNNIFIVIKDDDKIAGYCIALLLGAEAEILKLAIAVEYRRQYYAHSLLERLLSNISKSAVQSVFLEVGDSNISAKNLYKSFGFEIIAARKKYYINEDALILRKVIK